MKLQSLSWLFPLTAPSPSPPPAMLWGEEKPIKRGREVDPTWATGLAIPVSSRIFGLYLYRYLMYITWCVGRWVYTWETVIPTSAINLPITSKSFLPPSLCFFPCVVRALNRRSTVRANVWVYNTVSLVTGPTLYRKSPELLLNNWNSTRSDQRVPFPSLQPRAAATILLPASMGQIPSEII